MQGCLQTHRLTVKARKNITREESKHLVMLGQAFTAVCLQMSSVPPWFGGVLPSPSELHDQLDSDEVTDLVFAKH